MKESITIGEIILFSICLVLAFFLLRGCDIPVDKSKYIPTALYDASQDSLHISINKFGEQEAKTKLMTGTISDLKKLNSSKDSSIQKLLALVDKHTIGATILSTATSSTVGSGTISHPKDTVKIKGKDSVIYIYPEYAMKKPRITKWDSVWAKANKDTFLVSYKVYNEFDITQRLERKKVKGKLFKQQIPMVSVINKNPNTITRELKSFALEPPKKSRGKAFIAGAMVAIILEKAIKNFLTKNK